MGTQSRFLGTRKNMKEFWREEHPSRGINQADADIQWLIKALNIMLSIALDMADQATGNNGDYGEVEQIFLDHMKVGEVPKTE